MPKISVEIPAVRLADLDEHVGDDGKFVNRSDAVRASIRKTLDTLDEIDARHDRLDDAECSGRTPPWDRPTPPVEPVVPAPCRTHRSLEPIQIPPDFVRPFPTSSLPVCTPPHTVFVLWAVPVRLPTGIAGFIYH